MTGEGTQFGGLSIDVLTEGDENEAKEYKSGKVLRDPDGKHTNEIAKQLVAFANAGGGVILFGVDDAGEVDNIDLDEELSLGTISKTARMKCQPPVQFLYQYFSQDQGEVENGDVFAVEVGSRRSIPHAIVDNSEGEIRKREYRLRAGDESRLVTNDELEWMFENNLSDLGDSYKCRSWVIFDEENEIKSPPIPHSDQGEKYRTQLKTAVPTGTSFLTHFIDALSNEEYEAMTMGEVPFGTMLYFIDVLPFALLMSFSNVFSSAWYIDWDEEQSPNRDRKISTLNDEVPSQEIRPDDIEVEGEGATLSHLDLNPIGQMKRWDGKKDSPFLTLPEDTQVRVELDESLPEFPAIAYTESSVHIESDNIDFRIDSNWTESGRHYPTGHPESLKTDSVEIRDMLSIQIDIDYSTEFGFPKVNDPYLKEHQHFGRKIKHLLQEEWDADQKIEERKEEVIFEIDGKLDKLIDELATD